MANLFQRERPEHYLIAHIDGGARGNPGPAGYGALLEDESGKKIAELSEFLGVRTNNFAEYSGLLAAIAYAVAQQQKALLVVSDSELLVKQMKGQYKVRAPELQTLHKRAQEMVRQLDWFEIRHVRREQNREADRLANAAMDSGMGGKRAVEANAYAKKPGPQARSAKSKAAGDGVKNGIVKNGVVEFLGEPLPEGTLVKVRTKD
ncbi:MAG: ribonuclease HI family protein [Acidobacteriota bacterium]|nr:ribonuclease HI family protein [Acidobacteriota bacterium]